MYNLKIWEPAFEVDEHNRLNFSLIMIARRRSGKSYLIEYLYKTYWEGHYDFVIVFTTPINAKNFKRYLGSKRGYDIYTDPNDVVRLRKAIDVNTKRKNQGKKPINTLVIFDDTVSLKQKYDKDILNLFTKGRHANLSVVYTTQAPTLVDNNWKGNSDLIFIWKQKTRKNQEYIADNIVNGILDEDFQTVKEEKDAYISILKKATEEKYQFLVIDSVRDDLFFYKAGSLKI
jgi:hypothetical protein